MKLSGFFVLALIACCLSLPTHNEKEDDRTFLTSLYTEDEDAFDDENSLKKSPGLAALEEISESEHIPDEKREDFKKVQTVEKKRDQESPREVDPPTDQSGIHVNVGRAHEKLDKANPLATEKEDLPWVAAARIPIRVPSEDETPGKANPLAAKEDLSWEAGGGIRIGLPAEDETPGKSSQLATKEDENSFGGAGISFSNQIEDATSPKDKNLLQGEEDEPSFTENSERTSDDFKVADLLEDPSGEGTGTT